MASKRKTTSKYGLDDDGMDLSEDEATTMESSQQRQLHMDNVLGADSNNNGDDDDDDVTAKAFANIQAQLASFTSSKVGTTIMDTSSYLAATARSSTGYYDTSYNDGRDDYGNNNNEGSDTYTMDPVQWMIQELDSDEDELGGGPSMPGPSKFTSPRASSSSSMMTTPRKTPILERANTPIMSNSSSKKNSVSRSRLRSRRSSSASSDDDDSLPAPVQTPGGVQTPTRRLYNPARSAVSPASVPINRSVTALTNPSMNGNNLDRRYHDVLHNYLKSRRSLSDRMELEAEELALTLDAAPASIGATSLAANECMVEVDFLRQLNYLAWSESTSTTFPMDASRLEGNTWMMLARLRKIGLAAVLWADDTISNEQHKATQKVFLQQVASQKETTDRDLLEQLANDHEALRPLVVQRQYEMLEWLRASFDPVCIAPPPKSTKTQMQNAIPDDVAALIGEGSPCLDHALLKSCLSHIMAGRIDKAQQIARDYGQPWRAAVFGGGKPHGFEKVPNPATKTIDSKRVGNPHRFLWKQQMWRNGAVALKTRREESAVYSFLANDIKTCFGNPMLQTWEHGLAVICNSMWGRLEDLVLQLNHNQRREEFPEHKQEQQQMIATADLDNCSNRQVIEMLASSPFEQMRGDDEYHQAMSAIFIGKNALTNYVTSVAQNCGSFDESKLRFLAHLMLYLDSLSACSTPIVLENLADAKNKILFEYVQYLASEPERWSLLTLYVSLMPDQAVMDFFPSILVQVLDNRQRKVMLEQARDLFSSIGMDLQLLRKVVRLIMKENRYEENDPMNDVVKSRSIEWLLQYEEHFGDALVCANMLLREFFLHSDDDKIESASVFVEEHLPADLLQTAGQVVPTVEDGVSEEAYHEKIEYAKHEHLAFVSYLDAYAAFGEWKDVISSKRVGSLQAIGNGNLLNSQRMNKIEAGIARQLRVREWTKDVAAKAKDIVGAAIKAQQTLHDVLSLPGGWLSIDGEPDKTQEDEDRQRDINSIRGRYVVLAVNLYHQVCQDTASWMSRTLDDAVPKHFTDRKSALTALDDATDEKESLFSPIHWYQTALDLAEVVSSDKYEVYKSFEQADLQEFLSHMAETAVLQSMEAI